MTFGARASAVDRTAWVESGGRPASLGPIVPVQLLRGIAASGVVVQHVLERYARRGAVVDGLPAFVDRLGEVGVATFFAISGFIMVHIALNGATPPTPIAFLRSRFLRVAPLYYLTTLAMLAFMAATRSFSTRGDVPLPGPTELVLSFLFIPHRGVRGVIQPVYELGWTLQYEMFFYLMFALGLAVLARRAGWAVLGALVMLVVIGIGIDAPPQRFGLPILAYVFTRPILLYFAVGIILALVRHRLGERLPSMPAMSVALLGIAALAVAAVAEGLVMPLIAVAVALGTAVLVRPRYRDGPFRRMSQAFGDASYSIYLTHSFLLGAFAAVTAGVAGRGPVALLAMVLLACAACAIAGWIIWALVERPIDRLLRSRGRGRVR